jgi:F-type H+-transporting ATPase subunit a
MIPVEIIGAIVKPVALTIRLFANMTAGHVLLAAIIGFTTLAAGGLGLGGGSPIILISWVASIAIFYLEIFVACLQAFVFTFLVAVFIAQMSHHDHDDHGHEHNRDGEGHAIPDGAALGAA